MVLAPFLIVVEAISYGSRAISLGVRLAANLIAGHLLLSIILGFAFSMLGGAGIAGFISYDNYGVYNFIRDGSCCDTGVCPLFIDYDLFRGHDSIALEDIYDL